MIRFFYERAELPLPLLNRGVPPPALRVAKTQTLMTQAELLIQTPAGAVLEDAAIARQALAQMQAALGTAAWIDAANLRVYQSLVSDAQQQDWLRQGYQIQLDPPSTRYATLDAMHGEVTLHWTAAIDWWWSLFVTLPTSRSAVDGEKRVKDLPVILATLREIAPSLAAEPWETDAGSNLTPLPDGFEIQGNRYTLRSAVRVYGGEQCESRRLGVRIDPQLSL